MARSTKKRPAPKAKRPKKATARFASDVSARELEQHKGRRGNVHRTEADEAQERAAGGEIRGPLRQR